MQVFLDFFLEKGKEEMEGMEEMEGIGGTSWGIVEAKLQRTEKGCGQGRR